MTRSPFQSGLGSFLKLRSLSWLRTLLEGVGKTLTVQVFAKIGTVFSDTFWGFRIPLDKTGRQFYSHPEVRYGLEPMDLILWVWESTGKSGYATHMDNKD